MAINEGKRFEQNWKKSVEELENMWIYRLKDNAASFGGSNNTRFASHNMCDYIMFEDGTKTLYTIELKSTKSTSVPLSMIRDNQIDELTNAGKHNLVAGFLINFRNKNNDTYFIEITNFNRMISEINKKSFNQNDLKKYNAIYVESECKKVNYKYNIKKFIFDTHL
jgi:recombination protein U|nr:MAG TPA: penicillin-binding protein-related factor A [Caudoviricetes sp.]